MAIFKQSEGSGINSKADTFSQAVVRLTVYYTAGVFVILSVFSVLVYTLFSTNIADRIDDDRRTEESLLELAHEPLLHEVTENLFDILILSDIILLILTIIVSYILARKTLAPLREAHERQERFVADAAHELRTPLAVLKAGSELILQRERTVPKYIAFIEEGKEEIDRLIALANDLLALSQSVKKGNAEHTDILMSVLCQKQYEYVLPYAQKKDVTVHATIDQDIHIHGNADALSRLVLNLLKNAIDYNVTNGTVTLSLTVVDEKIELTVQDTGVGIAPQDTKRIFERFTKIDTSRTQHASSGSGLGLALVEEIAQAHKGTITVESVLGKGSTFTLRFPCV